ncbi:acyl-CoA thioesterase [Aspergillus ellipticus CBS 707.79]|uniref:Acyl-CoA thioesterase n=1 Tax=Aspergillus ellipticus CBS 707.79 TaxID=1448320 RepID=A0A319EEU7_9EURO|nr:acyl-CoA thioesterase [Aspergillus ellipticus CBS 707.79]
MPDKPYYTSSPSAFADLMSLRRLPSPPPNPLSPEQTERFESLAPPYPPGEGTRAFGGHVYAQSAYAASKTVTPGFVIHNITGTFILGALLDTPYEYTVRHLRDGKMYCTRAVDARQHNQIIFSSLCSFKRDENQNPFSHQPRPVQERYAALLDGKKPEDFMVSPSVDADWWIEEGLEGREFPGVDVRKVDMRGWNRGGGRPEGFRQLAMYSLKGGVEEEGRDDGEGKRVNGERGLRERDEQGEFDNLYACAHMYACDRNSLLLIPRALGQRNWTSMASLTLTVVFHRLGEALRMLDWEGDRDGAEGKGKGKGLKKKWFVQEGWTPRSGENRAVHESWLWTPDGQLLATSIQDSQLRLSRWSGEKL